jgi:pyridoxine kinase
MRVISVQSQVAWGHVGASAAVPALQAAGVETVSVPTTLLSNHPRHPTVRGRVLDGALVADLLLGVEERGFPAQADWLLTGYMGSAANAEAAAEAATRWKAANPGLRYLCDPVMGDADIGFFAPAPVREAIARRLVPLADALTPNQFELGALSGRSVASAADCVAAARGLGAGLVLVTGAVFADPEVIATLAVTAEDAWIVEAPRVDRRPGGAGDLFAALFLAGAARGMSAPDATAHAASGVSLCLRETAEGPWPEMPLTACLAALARPAPLFAARRLDL